MLEALLQLGSFKEKDACNGIKYEIFTLCNLNVQFKNIA